MPVIENSTYLDLTSYRLTDETTVVEAYDLDPSSIEPLSGGTKIQVALFLERANDPTELLNQDWATRQATLARMEADDTLWSTYGTDPAVYENFVDKLQDSGISIIDSSTGFVSSAESRTVWIELTPDQFATTFGTPLMVGQNILGLSTLFWEGNLSIPDDWNISLAGLWPELSATSAESALVDHPVDLPQGPQSIGNASSETMLVTPDMLAKMYDFPLTGSEAATGTIALIEPSIGSALPGDYLGTGFQAQLDAYRHALGIDTPGSYYVDNPEGQHFDISNTGVGGERSLDVGVVAGAAPNSTIGIYVGAAGSLAFSAYQSAIWDQENDPGVISSSFVDNRYFSPDSPFFAAYDDLFVDAALRNQSVFLMAFDGGSGNQIGNGLTNVFSSLSSPFAVSVGGTSINTSKGAESDTTLDEIVDRANGHDLATLKMLMAGGLDRLPEDADDTTALIETVWNTYTLDKGEVIPDDYYWNAATSGGVDPTRPTPWYQSAFGLAPTTSDRLAESGRGVPDVAALAGGNLFYQVPSADMTEMVSGYGTSASTPLWASLAAQVNAVFADQGLPQMGYVTDLLYNAAVIAPGAFNDVQLGNNTSSYADGVPTGFGYEAGPGYDLTTGLGSPNGVLLTRALTTIAHGQLYGEGPDLLSADGGSAASQSLLFQPVLASDSTIDVVTSNGTVSWGAAAGSAYAWTSQLAQQSLQEDFDASLVRLFDGHRQARAYQLTLEDGESLTIDIAGQATTTPQAALSNDYGFVDFLSLDPGSAVRVARVVAVAETAGGADDQEAIVRLRQNGEKQASLLIYEVDDLTGTIDSLAPGDAGYDAASQARAYRTADGDRWIDGPGFGEYLETSVLDVDAGDLVAMRLSSGSDQFFAFAQANEAVDGAPVNHLWNYGLNTWGWEDMKGGGDLDYNDIIVQLDFISATGSRLVA
ncbi:DUF4114 domain-containing protein [Geminicoccus flavidas]|uniref:DUF4114 domain-containing protein n=1 Tax=Geminicoccus flavidas TaxID=2506407 RepID=UPI00135AA22B|nr:S8 family serine peptidase [Geminicoccus flavidas]